MTPLSTPSLTLIRPQLSRRCFLKAGAVTAGMCLVPHLAQARISRRELSAHERALAFYNTHTGERLKTVYWLQGDYVAEALATINHVLRDHRANAVKAIDPHLLDLLHAMQHKLDSNQPFYVISGYRTPTTNALLRRRSKHVSKRSFHMQGKAVDVRLPGHSAATLRRVALALRGGGVGFYPGSNFIHVDTGRVRSW